MSELMFNFYYWFTFIWGAAGMLFIAVVVIREIFMQMRSLSRGSNSRPETHVEMGEGQ
ncbi:hypothetical protein [Ferviditalea candida]|uniref:Heme exporter protein D n=1 Tax=Ferviditalea candida TaxID=3108399 RepID=A0ABU5ZQK4_9BACL|nr:hypothetical protein [Paenibacillaceae bacterium T2]